MGAVEQHIVIPYAPRPLQAQIHEALDAHRYAVVVCHRRFGKTVMAINHLIRAAVLCEREAPRFAYIAPTYTQAKSIAWDYLRKYTLPIPGCQYNQSELRVDLPNGARIRLYGADSPDSLRGIYLDGVVFDEFGLMDGRTYSEVIRPALSDRQGWAVFIGTPNGRNAFWTMRDTAAKGDGWYLAEFKASQTKYIDARELAESRKQMTPDEFAQEYECSFEASVRGAIFATELGKVRADGRVTKVGYDPIVPVKTFWDLGVGDATAIWFAQGIGNEVHLIDYHEASGEGLPYYKAMLDAKGYVYSDHWAPHDIQVRELASGRSRLEVARSMGINFRVVPNTGLEDGIHAARMILARCWFDSVRCQPGIEAMTNYRRDYNNRLAEFKATPIHDWASHGADAFRYLAVAWKDHAGRDKPLVYDNRGIV